MKKTLFIKNAAILTASSLILRFAGILFKVWLAKSIGSEGIGLYQLIFSVYMLAATFATSGICTAVTRLIADELALGSRGGIIKILKRCVALTLIIAAVSVAVLWFSADFIAERFLSDVRAAPAIKVLSFSLPFMAVSSCLRGYFIARRKATPTAASQILEQTVRILLVTVLVGKTAQYGLSVSCAAVLFGDTAAEAISALYLYLRYRYDLGYLKRLNGRARPPYSIIGAITHIALPITAGRYLNTALRTTENVLVPKCLAKCKSSGENALSQFGMIKGMALPILFFPSTLLNALSTMLIPEMSEASARGRKGVVRSAVERILQITMLVSYVFASVFFVAGGKLGELIYHSSDVGFLLRFLAPIVPFMYLDSVSDGILKGLDQQRFTFRTSICDSGLRLLLVVVLLPKKGLAGFLGIMYLSNFLTCTLNVGRLIKVSNAKIDLVYTVFLPITSALCVTLTANLILRLFSLQNVVYIILLCAITLPAYAVLLFVFGCVSPDDIRDIFK